MFVDATSGGDLKFVEDAETGRYTITDNGNAVLTYNFKTVPVPAGVSGKYAVARCDYVHPLYGPGGEILTKDYSPEHPHHRGIYWAWPEVSWKGEKRDLHALQGVFARPVKIARKEVADGCAVLEAESVWKWGDTEPIVKELAKIAVSQEREGRRVLDFEFKFESLVDGVTVARRGQAHYGGFNVRLSARENQKITTYTDDQGKNPRRAWACLAGIPPAGKQPVSLVILQNAGNPEYPGDWIQYPNLNWLQPTFPSKGTAYALKTGVPLVLKYRLVICNGEVDEAMMRKLCAEYQDAK
jgi:hypothetical protein